MDVPQSRVPVEDRNEAGSLASELARAYQQMSGFYRDQLHLSAADADVVTRGLDQTPEQALADLLRIREQAPDQVDWGDLQRLANLDPDELVAVWALMKGEARAELASGHRAASALEWRASPQDRARCLAIVHSFRSSTPPRDGIEAALLDTAAAAFSDHLYWSEVMHMQAGSEAASQRDSLERHGEWSPARLSAAEAIEQSSRMAERAHARLLRTIKMIHEMQRTSSTVYVGNAAQINIGEQQVNLTSRARVRKKRTDLPKSLGEMQRNREIVPVRRRQRRGN